MLLNVHAQLAAQPCLGRAGDASVEAHQLDGSAAARQPDVVHDVGHRADLRELALVLGHEQHALLVAHVDRERHAHVGEDDEVFKWD